MSRDGWAVRQAEKTRRNVALWPEWMRREGRRAPDPEMTEVLVEEIVAILKSKRTTRGKALAILAWVHRG